MSLPSRARSLFLFAAVPLSLCHASSSVDAATISPAPSIQARFFAFVVAPPPIDAGWQAKKEAEVPLPEGKGRDLTKKLCGTCHSTNVWTSQKHTSDQWSGIIDNMVSKGMEASDDDLATVNGYLAANFAPSKDTAPAPPTN